MQEFDLNNNAQRSNRSNNFRFQQSAETQIGLARKSFPRTLKRGESQPVAPQFKRIKEMQALKDKFELKLAAPTSLHSMSLETENSMFTQDSIMRHHAECKLENKVRLKQVKNLEELIKFKVKTVADKMAEEGILVSDESQLNGLYALRKVCDPLLQNSNFPQLSKKAYMQQINKLKQKPSFRDSSQSFQKRFDHDESVKQDVSLTDELSLIAGTSRLPPLTHDISQEIKEEKSESGTEQVSENEPVGAVSGLKPVKEGQTGESGNDPIKYLKAYFKHPAKKQGPPVRAGSYIMRRYEKDIKDRKAELRSKSQMAYGSYNDDELSSAVRHEHHSHMFGSSQQMASYILGETQPSKEQNSYSAQNIYIQSNESQTQFQSFADYEQKYKQQLANLQQLNQESMFELDKRATSIPSEMITHDADIDWKILSPLLRKSDIKNSRQDDSREFNVQNNSVNTQETGVKMQPSASNPNADLNGISIDEEDATRKTSQQVPDHQFLNSGQAKVMMKRVFEDDPSQVMVSGIMSVSKSDVKSPLRPDVSTLGGSKEQTNSNIVTIVNQQESALKTDQSGTRSRGKVKFIQSTNERSQNTFNRSTDSEATTERVQDESSEDEGRINYWTYEEKGDSNFKRTRELIGQLPLDSVNQEMKQMLGQMSGNNPISILSKIASTKSKDYVAYNQQQLDLYNKLRAQKVSTKRVEMMAKKREQYFTNKSQGITSSLPVVSKRRGRSKPVSKQVTKLPPVNQKKYDEDLEEPRIMTGAGQASNARSSSQFVREVAIKAQEIAETKDYYDSGGFFTIQKMGIPAKTESSKLTDTRRSENSYQMPPRAATGERGSQQFSIQANNTSDPVCDTMGDTLNKTQSQRSASYTKASNKDLTHVTTKFKSNPNASQELMRSQDYNKTKGVVQENFDLNIKSIKPVQSAVKTSLKASPTNVKQKKKQIDINPNAKSSTSGAAADISLTQLRETSAEQSQINLADLAKDNVNLQYSPAKPNTTRQNSRENQAKMEAHSQSQGVMQKPLIENKKGEVETVHVEVKAGHAFDSMPQTKRAKDSIHTKHKPDSESRNSGLMESGPSGMRNTQMSTLEDVGFVPNPYLDTTEESLEKNEQSLQHLLKSPLRADQKEPIEVSVLQKIINIEKNEEKHKLQPNASEKLKITPSYVKEKNVIAAQLAKSATDDTLKIPKTEDTPSSEVLVGQPAQITDIQTPILFKEEVITGKDLGYVTQDEVQDPTSKQFESDILNTYYQREGFSSKRFKKFPRFSIYLTRDIEKSHLDRNYISLNQQVLQYLACDPPIQELQSDEVSQEDTVSPERRTNSYDQGSRESSKSRSRTTTLEHSKKELSPQIKNQKQINKIVNKILVNQEEEQQEQPALRPAVAVTSEKKTVFGDSDPFEKVLLLKNIDNAILTSYRTLSKQNNVISHTMKVVHQKFAPLALSKKNKKQYKAAISALYPVSETDEFEEKFYIAQPIPAPVNQSSLQSGKGTLRENSVQFPSKESDHAGSQFAAATDEMGNIVVYQMESNHITAEASIDESHRAPLAQSVTQRSSKMIGDSQNFSMGQPTIKKERSSIGLVNTAPELNEEVKQVDQSSEGKKEQEKKTDQTNHITPSDRSPVQKIGFTSLYGAPVDKPEKPGYQGTHNSVMSRQKAKDIQRSTSRTSKRNQNPVYTKDSERSELRLTQDTLTTNGQKPMLKSVYQTKKQGKEGKLGQEPIKLKVTALNADTLLRSTVGGTINSETPENKTIPIQNLASLNSTEGVQSVQAVKQVNVEVGIASGSQEFANLFSDNHIHETSGVSTQLMGDHNSKEITQPFQRKPPGQAPPPVLIEANNSVVKALKTKPKLNVSGFTQRNKNLTETSNVYDQAVNKSKKARKAKVQVYTNSLAVTVPDYVPTADQQTLSLRGIESNASNTKTTPFLHNDTKLQSLRSSNPHWAEPKVLTQPSSNSLQLQQQESVNIAQRVILPDTTHKLKSMIDNLYSKEKQYIYSKQYVREECLGNQNIIFNLEKSQIVNKVPGITRPKKPQTADEVDKNREFGVSLIGEKAQITQVASKPQDIRRGRGLK